MAMNLTVPDATAIFKSIKQACEEREAVEIEIGELRWKTDARLRSSDGIIIQFDGASGRGGVIAQRQDVETAIIEFDDRFGSKARSSRGE
jgi:hypothetical protein